jgi:hypothetical protein
MGAGAQSRAPRTLSPALGSRAPVFRNFKSRAADAAGECGVHDASDIDNTI